MCSGGHLDFFVLILVVVVLVSWHVRVSVLSPWGSYATLAAYFYLISGPNILFYVLYLFYTRFTWLLYF